MEQVHRAEGAAHAKVGSTRHLLVTTPSSMCLEGSGQAGKTEMKLEGQPTRDLGRLAKDFRFNLTRDGEILKRWGQGARTPSRDPVVGKEATPPSSYLSMSRQYRKVDFDSRQNGLLP